MAKSLQARLEDCLDIRRGPGSLDALRRARAGRKAHQIDVAAVGAPVQVLAIDEHNNWHMARHAHRLQERAAMLADGHVHPGMPALEALPLRFIWHVSLTLGAVIIVSLVAVRHAAEAFNFMQHRLRQLVVERGRALAAVSHDLHTPLTRMRVRAEMVDDANLQNKLNADIDAMQGMVNSVLAYLRGLEDAEPIHPLNMEELLSSIVEDEQALGRKVFLAEAAPGHKSWDLIRQTTARIR